MQQVHANRELAELMTAQAVVHLRSSRAVADVYPVGAFQLAHAAPRTAWAAIPLHPGFVPSGGGGAQAEVLTPAQTVDNIRAG